MVYEDLYWRKKWYCAECGRYEYLIMGEWDLKVTA